MHWMADSLGTSTYFENYYECQGSNFRLPIFTLCNGLFDCPGREDEANCKQFDCKGLYRCMDSRVCVDSRYMCDYIYHCPLGDDELYCSIRCPTECQCHGLQFTCNQINFDLKHKVFRKIRYLHAAGTNVTPSALVENTFLIHLNLAECQLRDVDHLALPNLLSLDLSYNLIRIVPPHAFVHTPNLHVLFLVGNPLAVDAVSNFTLSAKALTQLDLSEVFITGLHPRNFHLPNLRILNVSDAGIEEVSTDSFRYFPQLQDLDIRGCPLTHFARDAIRHLKRLRYVQSHVPKICCPSARPDSLSIKRCEAPSTVSVSYCENMFKSSVHRTFWLTFASVALLSNLACLVARLRQKGAALCGDAMHCLLTQLHVWDFGLTMYLVTIAIADQVFSGDYVWRKPAWQLSITCKGAGFLFTLCNHMASCVVFSITLERFVVVYFPISGRTLNRKSIYLLTILTLILAFVMGDASLGLMTSKLQTDYADDALCQPYFFRKIDPSIQTLSFSSVIFQLFVNSLVGIGQLSVNGTVRRQEDITMTMDARIEQFSTARRLFHMALFNCLRWLVLGGVTLYTCYSSLTDSIVTATVIIVPASCACNPLLLFLGSWLEHRRVEMKKRLMKILMTRNQAKIAASKNN